MSEKKKVIGQNQVEDADSDAVAALEEGINQVGLENKNFQKSATFEKANHLQIMMFDDKQEVLDLYRNAAEQISKNEPGSISVKPILTTKPDHVAAAISNEENHIDLILIDNNFSENIPTTEKFYAAEVLAKLNNYSNSKSSKSNTQPRFLPRIVVTQEQYDPAIVEQLSVAGADKVVFGKGRTDSASDDGHKTAAQQLLGKLLQPDEWDDICQRACHRLWRELLLFVEEKIRASKASPSTADSAQATMAGLMNAVRAWMEEAGVADTITFRIAEREHGDGVLMLRDVVEKNGQLPRYRWDESPLLKTLANQDLWRISRAKMITRKLSKAEVPVDPLGLLAGNGSHGIGVPLTCGHGFFGTIAMTRRRKSAWTKDKLPHDEHSAVPDTDPARFTALEAEYLVRLAQRLSLFYEQLLDATRLRRRQQGLLNLAESLAQHASQVDMIRAAVEFLHNEFHIHSELAYSPENYNGAPGGEGKIVCRLLDHATGLVYCPVGARKGYEDGHRPSGPRRYDHSLTMEYEQNIYVMAINTGKTQYCIDSQVNRSQFNQDLYPARAVIVEPLAIQGRSIGALKVANKKPNFYGPDPQQIESGSTGNDNLDLLRSVANILVQALHESRLLKFEQALIELAASTGPGDEQKVMDNMAQALYAYIGPGILLWWEGNVSKELQLKAGWFGKNVGELRIEIIKNIPSAFRRMDNEAISRWAAAPANEDTHLERTYRNYINDFGEIDNYSEDENQIVADQDKRSRDFPTKSQYSLVLIDQYADSSKRSEQALGVLALLFNQKNAVTLEQKQFLRRFGNFIGTYLASVRRHNEFLGLELQRELAEFMLALSHQVRHTLKSNINSLINGINLEKKGGPGTYIKDPNSLIAKLSELAAELSVTYLLPVDLSLKEILPRICWQRACTMLKDKAESTNIIISDLMGDDACICNENILENTFFVILDNALDAIKGADDVQLTKRAVWAEAYNKDSYLIIDIFDSGPGFTNEIKARFGELRLSTKPTGSGTGLYWCKRFLPLVKGKIELLESTAQARIRLTLQRKQDDTAK